MSTKNTKEKPIAKIESGRNLEPPLKLNNELKPTTSNMPKNKQLG